MHATHLLTIGLVLSARLAWPAAALAVDSGSSDDTFAAGGGRVTIALSPSLSPMRVEVLEWAHRAADAVTAYYGQFPVPAVQIVVAPRPGEPVNSGSEHEGRRIVIHLDPGATRENLRQDWMLTHEMFHLGFPSLNRKYHYMEEGLADYLEPVARARKGQVTAQHAWKDFVDGMPQGLPGPGDGGLDGTHAWGKTYWGGCLFWLLVDLDIRQQTGNAKRLDDAIRAIVQAGGTGGEDWPVEKMVAIGDRATGTGSIAKIHRLMGPAAYDPQLDQLWRRLGVREKDGQIGFDENAPLAAIRRSITAPD